MLADLLKVITPEMLVQAVRSNPVAVLSALQKFDTYVSFGQALTVDQQVCLSMNLTKVNDFIKSEQGKTSLSMLAEEFVAYVKEHSKQT
jgi:hypothetical protein